MSNRVTMRDLNADDEAREKRINIDLAEVDNIVFDGIDHNDHPDYCDVYICSADYNGVPIDQEQLDELNEDREFVYDNLMRYLY